MGVVFKAEDACSAAVAITMLPSDVTRSQVIRAFLRGLSRTTTPACGRIPVRPLRLKRARHSQLSSRVRQRASTVTSDLAYDEVATKRTVRGVPDVIATWQAWAAALPDSKATFEAAHVAGNTVILELTWRGTQTGALRMPTGESPATGRKIEVRACQIIDLADGKTRSVRHYFNVATMMTQLGVNMVGAHSASA
jgi:steroid delta-isomerase-like uncharacterized protein